MMPELTPVPELTPAAVDEALNAAMRWVAYVSSVPGFLNHWRSYTTEADLQPGLWIRSSAILGGIVAAWKLDQGISLDAWEMGRWAPVSETAAAAVAIHEAILRAGQGEALADAAGTARNASGRVPSAHERAARVFQLAVDVAFPPLAAAIRLRGAP